MLWPNTGYLNQQATLAQQKKNGKQIYFEHLFQPVQQQKDFSDFTKPLF